MMKKLDPGTSLQVGTHSVEIIKYLAEGGFAHIYTVKYRPLVDDHEIAVLKRVIVNSKVDLNLLRKEVDTMQRLATSKYVVKYYDSNAQKLDDGTYEVLVLMEYCPNKSLLDYMNLHLKTKLSVDQITKIMYQISSAVYSMHYLNLIHRDLKIENVLIDSDENFKLADFGSTTGFINPPKSQEEFQFIANDIIHNTTPQYRAPEMIDLYRNLPIDNKSDIWALGVFLYKLMYYTTPFETQGELAILHGFFQFPEHPKYPSKLKNLIIIMLQVNPTLRPNIYQVLFEVCKLLDKPLKAEDFYGLGAYDFDSYAKFQQQLQYQQQQQQIQIQQQLMQQQYIEQQRKQAELGKQRTSSTDVIEESLSVEPTQNSLMQQPHELTRSSNPSVGDLSELERELAVEDDVNSVVYGDDDDDDDDDELNSNVEERFPDLNDLDENIIAQKYPNIDGSDLKVDSFESERSPIMKLPQHSTSRASSVHSKINLSDNLDKEVESLKSSKTPEDIKTKEESEVPNLGLKLGRTEAWTLPSNKEDIKNIEIDGVFHRSQSIGKLKEEINEPENVKPIAPLSEKSSFDKLFDFGPESQRNGLASVSDFRSTSLPQQALRQSRNPFPTAHENTSKNPFPASASTSIPNSTSTLDIKKVVEPQRSGGNPWAQFSSQSSLQKSQSQGPLQTNVQPQVQQQVQLQLQAQKQPAYVPMSTSNSFTYGAVKTQPSLQSLPQYISLQSSNLQVNNAIKADSLAKDKVQPLQSPLIQITPSQATTNLIDFENTPTHTRPKLDLNLLKYDVSDEKSMIDGATTTTKTVSDSDTDSDGGLKVEEISIPKTRSKHGSSGASKKSVELSRLSLEMEEMDLNDISNSVTDDTIQDLQKIEDNDEVRHSRRSMSLRRPSTKTPRSRSNRRSEEITPSSSSKRKSFLGF